MLKGMSNKISLLTLGIMINWCYGKLLARKISGLYISVPERIKEESEEGTNNIITESRSRLFYVFSLLSSAFSTLSFFPVFSLFLFLTWPFARIAVTPSCFPNAVRPHNKIQQQCSSFAFVPKFFARIEALYARLY